jgi:hypothetical protein
MFERLSLTSEYGREDRLGPPLMRHPKSEDRAGPPYQNRNLPR